NMRQTVIISGQETVTQAGGSPTVTPNGIFAWPSNSGRFHRDVFAAVPELNLNAMYHISPNWRLLGGYSLVYWTDVVLAGTEIDRAVNSTQIPGPQVGPTRPLFAFHREHFWAQGFNLGAEYRW